MPLARSVVAFAVCLAALATAIPASAQPLTAVLTTPADGAVNVDVTQPFQWTAVAGAQAYVLWVGTAAGAKDLVNTPETAQTFFPAASTLPGAQLLYARMWTKVAGVWRSVDSTFTTAPIATLKAPANGAANVNPLAAFQWTTVTSAQAYVLWVGTTPGTHDVVYTPQVHQPSYVPASGLPAGETLYARMWTEVGGVWRSVDSAFTTAASAWVSAPQNGSLVTDPRPTFSWSPVAGAQTYYLYVGTAPGLKDLVNTGEIQATAYRPATPLPSSLPLYVRLWTKWGGVWRFVDSQFTIQPAAYLTTPSDGATNVAPDAPFVWTPVAGAQSYYLYVGTQVGAKDLVNTGELHATSYTGPALPAGQLLYARMWTKVGDVWRFIDSTFTSARSASIVAPQNGSIVTNPRPTFTWSTVPGAQAYSLSVGTSPGAHDIVDSGEIQATSYQPVTPLPNFSHLYMRVGTQWGGVWQFVDAQFTVQALAFLTTPADGSTDVPPNVAFVWTAVDGAQAYYLYVGTQAGAKDVVNTGEVHTTSYAAAQLPANRTLFARMWVKSGGAWRYVDSQFTTMPLAALVWPVTGSTNIDPNATFTWTAAPGASLYRLTVGTVQGGADVLDSGAVGATSYAGANLPGGTTLYARLWTGVNGAWFHTDATFTAAAILDDFSSLSVRQTTSGQDLWAHYDEGAPGMVALDAGALSETVLLGNNVANAGGAYLQFVPKTNNSYVFPDGYARRYLSSGTWNAEYNRLTFRMKVGRSVVNASDHLFEFGTYIRSHADTDVGAQGAHFYHFLSPNLYQDRWIYVTINRVPQHQVAKDSNLNWGENPTGDPYFDDLTRFYIDDIYQVLDGTTVLYDDFKFSRVDGEPDYLVSNTTAEYSGARYEVSWNTPKWVNQTYEISYSTQSLKTNGFESGTYGGWVASQGTAYTWVRWASPDMPQAPGGMFIGIRPVGHTEFTELYVPAN